MSDDSGLEAAVDEALAEVVAAAHAHLAAVRAAGGALDDPAVWDSYIALNNASHTYDQRLLEAYGEVTPWDTDRIDPAAPPEPLPPADQGTGPRDPYPAVVSVRQRRDYRVPSMSALLTAAAEAVARRLEPAAAAPRTAGEAVLELIRDGNGLLSGLDGPELEPVGGVVTISETQAPLAPLGGRDEDPTVFLVGPEETLVARLDEWPEPEVGPTG